MKKERLEAWKKQRELDKLKDGKAKSATPEPADRKSTFNSVQPTGKGESPVHCSVIELNTVDGVAALPAKPSAFSLGGLSRIGLPVKNGTVPTPLKRAITALDDEEASDRKLQKLELPEVNPEVQSGEAAQVDAIGDDLAVADGDEAMEEDINPEITPEVNGQVNGNGHAEVTIDVKPVEEKKEDVEMEDDEDPLDAYMNDIGAAVKKVNQTDAKRMGLLEQDHGDEDGPDLKNKAEEELTKAEALLQYVFLFDTEAGSLTKIVEWLPASRGRRIFPLQITV